MIIFNTSFSCEGVTFLAAKPASKDNSENASKGFRIYPLWEIQPFVGLCQASSFTLI